MSGFYIETIDFIDTIDTLDKIQLLLHLLYVCSERTFEEWKVVGVREFRIALFTLDNLYRIEQLEKKVNAHNNLVERTYKLEENEHLLFEKLKVINHRIDDLKGEL